MRVGSAADGLNTGDGTEVGLFIPLSKDLAKGCPSLAPKDNSDPHATFLYVGKVPDARVDEFLAIIQDVFSSLASPVRGSLGKTDYFTHPAYERTIAHMRVHFSPGLRKFRQQLREDLEAAGFEVEDSFPISYHPHVTLAYLEGMGKQYTGPRPYGGWSFDSIDVWGLPQEHTVKFGVSAKRVASAYQVTAKYQKKVEDEKGQTHYEYGPRQVAERHKEKAKKVEKLHKSMGTLRKSVLSDLKGKDETKRILALAVALIDATYERVGNEASAKEGHFGVTGWQAKHLKIDGGKATFTYVGKSGVSQKKVVDDARIVSVLRDISKGKSGGDALLSCGEDAKCLSASGVNEYLSKFGVTAKDLRGYHANREMVERLRVLRKAGPTLPHGRKEKDAILKKEFEKALKETAGAVGHEASTLRSDYLVPGLEDDFLHDGTVLEQFQKKSAGQGTDSVKSIKEFKSDIRRLTKIYKAIDDESSFQEAHTLFLRFAKNFGAWLLSYVPAGGLRLAERAGLRKFLPTDGFPGRLYITLKEGFPFGTRSDLSRYPDVYKLKRMRPKRMREYQAMFREVFKSLEQLDDMVAQNPEMAGVGALVEEQRFDFGGLHVVLTAHREDDDWRDMKERLPRLSGVARAVSRAGFSSVLGDFTLFITELPAIEGQYDPRTDSLTVGKAWGLDAETLVHELGHRFWFRNISNRGRRMFLEALEDVPLKGEYALSYYAESSPEEAYADAFMYYILKGPRSLGAKMLDLFSRVSESGGVRVRTAAKDQAEKEDEESDRLVRPSPKKKPPRKDKRRDRIRTEDDPDMGKGDRGDDKDLSLNYKRVGYVKNRQSYPYNRTLIDERVGRGEGLPPLFSQNVKHWRENMPRRMTKKGALQVISELERVASVVQENYEALGIPKKAALDLAYRCDLLSDHIEKVAGIQPSVKDNPGFDPTEIGKQESGALTYDKDEKFTKDNFREVENRELREKQEAGKLPAADSTPVTSYKGGKKANNTHGFNLFAK